MYLSLNIKDKEFADKFLLSDLIDLKGNVDTGLPLNFIFQFKNTRRAVPFSVACSALLRTHAQRPKPENLNHKITDMQKK